MPAGPRTGKDYALLFATDDYENWQTLNNPVRDATAITEVLKGVYGFETELVENPTRAKFEQWITAYSKRQYADDDQLFVFVAGHGDYIPDSLSPDLCSSYFCAIP